MNKGVELMHMFLGEINKYARPLVSIDLRNLDKPIIKFRKTPSIEFIHRKTERFAG